MTNNEETYEKAFENIELIASRAIPVVNDDYIGEDGLIYCGNCHTPKQARVELFGKIRTPMCVCKCAAERKQKEADEQKRREQFLQAERYRRMGFPESDMQSWNFANDDMSNPRLTNAMKKYVDNFKAMLKDGKGLLLYGTVGTGKTYAACEVANALIDSGYPVLVTNFARLTNTLQGMFEGKQEYIDSLNKFALLVIDDLGAERKSDFMQEMVYNIIDSRYRAGLPLIITTNLTIQEIKNPDVIGNTRIYDRLLERCFPIEVNGVSRRRKAVKDSYNDMKDLLGL